MAAETTHQCPPVGSGLTPCCGMTPFELPRTDRMTENPSLVTCHSGATVNDSAPAGAVKEDGEL
jgi:hypothetical protein